MKNIHVIPTDKPSRLYEYSNKLFTGQFGHGLNRNISITNSEEIKEGDWIYNSISNTVYQKKLDKISFAYEYKIILTTDPQLIANGVQAIDDTFFEWFVKNPSCEKVEVISNSDYEMLYKVGASRYKIIIPKEENIYDEYLKDELKKYKDVKTIVFNKPKQETLEEVKDLAYYKANAEEDYLGVPISVLRYISQLEQETEKSYNDIIKELEKDNYGKSGKNT